MTDQHRATPEQWADLGAFASDTRACILELRARIEALEAAPAFRVLETGERIQMNIVQDKLDRLIALDREDQTHDPAMTELRAWRPLDIETTYGSDVAADAAQILHAPMVVEGTFDHGGETYRYKAKPEREAPIPELRAASAEARPAGGLVERVAHAIGAGCGPDSVWRPEARDAIREVAAWLRDNDRADLASWLDQEATNG